MKILHLSIIVLCLLLLSTISSAKISHAENENPHMIIALADNTDDVEIQNIQVQPSKIRVGDTFTVNATLVNNSSNPIFLLHSACGSIFYVTFDNHATVNEKNKNCTADIIAQKINPGEKITGTSPPSGTTSISYRATVTGTANATVAFWYSGINLTDPDQSEIGKTISKSFLFTILDNSIGVKLANNTPLKQFKSGIAAQDVRCKEDLQLVIKSSNGSPACVKPETKQKLIERGWTTPYPSIQQKHENDVMPRVHLLLPTVIIPNGISSPNPSSPIPYVIVVKLGENDTVLWDNQDNVPLILRAYDKSWAAGIINPGERLGVKFNQTGFYEYLVELPERGGMRGEVVVLGDDVESLDLHEKLKMAQAILSREMGPNSPLWGLGSGNADNVLKISILEEELKRIPHAKEYYEKKYKEMIPFDVPIRIGFGPLPTAVK